MKDHLINFTDEAAASAALVIYAGPAGGYRLPEGAGLLPVTAYAGLGRQPVYGAAGVITPGEAPAIAPGAWFILSIDAGDVPAELAAHVAAAGDRAEGLDLPAGIAGLSSAWAGMTVRPS